MEARLEPNLDFAPFPASFRASDRARTAQIRRSPCSSNALTYRLYFLTNQMRTMRQKRLIGLLWTFFALILLVCGLSGSQAGAADEVVAANPEAAKVVNVIVINIDPVLKTRGGLKLHEHMKWSDPWQLTDKMVGDARTASHGFVNYRVVEKI